MRIRLRPLFVPTVIVACMVLLMSLAYRAPGETALRVMDYAEAKGIAFSEYPDSLIDLLDRNPETEEFVLHYPFRTENKVKLDGYDIGRGVPLFLQWDKQWGYLTYDSDFVAVTGSGPICLAMVGCYVTDADERFFPDRVVAFAQENGYAARTLISRGAAALGLQVKELPVVEQKIADYLHNGDPIIALLGTGELSDTGHYIVITDYDDGMFSINDPTSRANSEKQWPYHTLISQIRTLWVIGA